MSFNVLTFESGHKILLYLLNLEEVRKSEREDGRGPSRAGQGGGREGWLLFTPHVVHYNVKHVKHGF